MFPVRQSGIGSGPTRTLVGFTLAIVGLILERLPSLLMYYFLLGSGMSIVEYAQMTGALATAGFLLIGVGLFLLLRELVSGLPDRPAYLHVTPFVALAAALFLTATGLFYLLIIPALYGGSLSPPLPAEVYLALDATQWIAEIAIGLSVLVAVFGTVRTLKVRLTAGVVPPSP